MSALPVEWDPVPVQGIPALPVPVVPALVPRSGTPAADVPAQAPPTASVPAQDAPRRPGDTPRRVRPASRRSRGISVHSCSAVSRAEITAEITPGPPRPVAARPAAPAAGPPLRLTGRGRSAVAACAVVVATLLWFAVATAAHASAHGAPAGPAGSVMTRIVVQPGQTLWSIATRTDPSADPRLVVQRIVTVNKLTGESVAAGQRLWVPRG